VNLFAEKENARVVGWKDLVSIEINSVISCVSLIFAFLSQVLSFRENSIASMIAYNPISSSERTIIARKKYFYNSGTLDHDLHIKTLA
jgi:hypothetical protein